MDTVLFEKRGAIAWVTLNRPESLNAINIEMRDRLWEVWQAVRDDPDVRVVIMKGAGNRAFSSGADVREFGSAPSVVDARQARHDRDLWSLLLHLEKPTVAAIRGFALGGGLELGLFCDLRIAAEDARLGLPEVSLGYIPSAGGTQMLTRLLRRGQALELLLGGDPITAHQALKLGLVHQVAPVSELEAIAEQVALRLSVRPPEAMAAIKRAVNLGLDGSPGAALSAERALALRLLPTVDRGTLPARIWSV